jgi:HK97 family phage major capsid protein
MLKPTHSWTQIRALLVGGNLRIFAKSATAQHLAELDKEIAGLLAEAKAITDLADDEKRELTDEDVTRLSAIMDEDTGEVAKLQAERDKAAKIIALKKRSARAMDDLRRNRYSGLVSEDEEDDEDNPFAEDDDEEMHDEEEDEPQARRRRRSSRRNRSIRVVNRLKNFTGPNAARDAYDSGMYLRARIAQERKLPDAEAESYLKRRGWVPGSRRATHTEGTNSAGGFLVPDPLERSIIDVAEKHSVIRPLCTVMPMTADTLRINKKAGGLTVYYPGEAGTYTPSDASWSQFTMTAVKRGVFTKISQELRDDALIGVVDFLVKEIGLALGLNEDREIVSGTGVAGDGGVTGLVSALNVAGKHVPTNGTGKSVWSGLTMGEFTKTMALLPDRFDGFEKVWLVSRKFYYEVMLPLLVAAQGNTIAMLEAGAASGPRFLGDRVVFTERMPKTTAVSSTVALYGAFSQAVIIADRMGLQIGQSDQFAFDEDVLCIKASRRYDVEVHEPGGSGVAGAYVGLVTAAS